MHLVLFLLTTSLAHKRRMWSNTEDECTFSRYLYNVKMYINVLFCTSPIGRLHKRKEWEIRLFSVREMLIRDIKSDLPILKISISFFFQVLCVVSEGLDNFGCVAEPTITSFNANHPDWNSNPDCTGLITQDNIVIERYRKFLATWKRIIKLVFDTTRFNRQSCKKKPKLPRCSRLFNSKIKKTDGRSKKKDTEVNEVKKYWDAWEKDIDREKDIAENVVYDNDNEILKD